MFLAFSPFRASNAPRRPKRPPRPRQDRPRAPQDGPKTGSEGPRTAQETPRTAPDRPGTGPRWAQEREQEAPRGLGEASRTPQRPPKGPKRGPRRVPGAPEEAKIVAFLWFFRCFWPSHHSVLPTLQDGRRATSTPRGPGIPPRRHQKSPGAITSDREVVSERLLAYSPRQAV